MTEPTERDLFLANKILEHTVRDDFVPLRDIAAVIAAAREEGRREERVRICQYIVDLSRETVPAEDAHALCFELVEGISATKSDLSPDSLGTP